jgi:hypothetical protein
MLASSPLCRVQHCERSDDEAVFRLALSELPWIYRL